jgi:prophage antirepressor-like protein
MEKSNGSKFFLDVFNNILDYNDSKVIVIFDSNGDIWFGLKDLFKMLGYSDAKIV